MAGRPEGLWLRQAPSLASYQNFIDLELCVTQLSGMINWTYEMSKVYGSVPGQKYQ